MNTRSQKIAGWCGLLSLIASGIGLSHYANFVPPPVATAGAEEVARIYREHTNDIRIGMMWAMVSAGLFLPFTAVISAQMRRIEARTTPVWTYMQLGSGILAVAVLFIAPVFWSAAAFRPERDSQIILAMNDMGMMTFMLTAPVVYLQNAAIGIATLSDTSATPVYPRWFGYFQLLIGIPYWTGMLSLFNKTGAFAWDGAIAWWSGVFAFPTWTIVTVIWVIKAANRQDAIQYQ